MVKIMLRKTNLVRFCDIFSDDLQHIARCYIWVT